MKRPFIIMLMCVLLFIFSACGNSNTSTVSSGINDNTSTGVTGADSPEELVSKLEKLYTYSNPSDNNIAVLTYEFIFAKNNTDKDDIVYKGHSASIINNLRAQYGDDLKVIFSEIEIHKIELSEEKLQRLKSALAASYNDTDKIEALCDVSYNWKAVGSLGHVADTMVEQYIKVGDKWYIFDTFADYYFELDLK